MTENSFLKYSRPWPNYVTDYKPLVEFSRSNNHSVLASNIPRRYASYVANEKENILKELPAQEKTYFAQEIYSPRDRYYEKFEGKN
jgi:uncharacterized iron-regulated protein